MKTNHTIESVEVVNVGVKNVGGYNRKEPASSYNGNRNPNHSQPNIVDEVIQFTSIEELSEVIVRECRRVAEMKANQATNNRNRWATIAQDMAEELQYNVYIQIMDKPDYWNIAGIRSTINIYVKNFRKGQKRFVDMHDTYGDFVIDGGDSDDHGGLNEEVISAITNNAHTFETDSNNALFIADFFASSFYQSLSNIEKSVLDLHVQGVKLIDISDRLGLSVNVPRNSLNRIAKRAAAAGFIRE